MSKQLHCDFVFGDNCSDLKKMDYAILNSRVTETKMSCIGSFLWLNKAINQIFKPYKYYILLGQPNFLTAWVILLLSKFTHKKIYLWTHGWYGRENSLKRVVKRIFFGLSDGLLVYGDYAINLMLKEGITLNKLHPIHNSLDYDKQIEYRKMCVASTVYKSHFNNSNHNLIFIGRLTKVKCLDMILSVLKASSAKYNLTFIGTGEEQERLEKLVKQYSLEQQVWFYGACYQESELSNLIFNADMCVAPGNVGLTAIHCLTYGCPVVTHNNFPMQMPEFEVIEPGVTGDFFEYNNVDSLCEVIDNWFALNKDKEVVRSMSYKIIDSSWNPHYQIRIIKGMLK